MKNSKIQYISGNPTNYKQNINEVNIISHLCNDLGEWGEGFSIELENKYPNSKKAYELWAKQTNSNLPPFELGWLQMVQVIPDRLFIANMITKKGTETIEGIPPIRYGALNQCLQMLSTEARALKATVHMSKADFICAGAQWEKVERSIMFNLCTNVNVKIYR